MYLSIYSITCKMWIKVNILGRVSLEGRVFAHGPGDLGSITGCVIPKTLKIVLDTSLLNTQHYKVLSMVKWSNPGKGVAHCPTPRCSSYWKRSLLVTLDHGRQLLTIGLNSVFFSERGWHIKVKEFIIPI